MKRADIYKYSAIVGTTAIGFVGGYITAKRHLEQSYAVEMAIELQEIQEFYAKRHKEPPYNTPESASEALRVVDPIEAELESIEIPDDIPKGLESFARRQIQLGNDPRQAVLNMMTKIQDYVPDDQREVDDDHVEKIVDMSHARIHRDPTVPYTISTEEFMDNDNEHEQLTLTWYRGDRVLSDEREQPVDDIQRMVGYRNLETFGQNEADPHVIYVRNERMNADFEIVLDENKYAIVVAGEEAMMEVDQIYSKNRGGRSGRDD